VQYNYVVVNVVCMSDGLCCSTDSKIFLCTWSDLLKKTVLYLNSLNINATVFFIEIISDNCSKY